MDYVERKHNNEDGHEWRFRKILSHTLISGKKRKEDRIEVQYKIDDRHKIRIVKDKHLTAIPSESIYSGVVSL